MLYTLKYFLNIIMLTENSIKKYVDMHFRESIFKKNIYLIEISNIVPVLVRGILIFPTAKSCVTI